MTQTCSETKRARKRQRRNGPHADATWISTWSRCANQFGRAEEVVAVAKATDWEQAAGSSTATSPIVIGRGTPRLW